METAGTVSWKIVYNIVQLLITAVTRINFFREKKTKKSYIRVFENQLFKIIAHELKSNTIHNSLNDIK